MAFARSPIAQFLASGAGRVVRMVAGVALIAAGLAIIGGAAGAIVAAIGLVPLGAGAFDVCVISVLFGGPFSGQAIRNLGRRPAV